MSVLTSITEGWTKRLTWQILADGAAFDGTGFTVSDIRITGKDGTIVDVTGDIGWVTAASGTVYYDPDATDFDADLSPYTIHFVIQDGSGKQLSVPNGKAYELKVYRL